MGSKDSIRASELMRQLTDCSSEESIKAEKAICQSNEVLSKLALACGANVSKIGMGGAVIWLSVPLVVAPEPSTTVAGLGGMAAGFGLINSGAHKVKRYCKALVMHSTAKIGQQKAEFLSSILD